MTIQPLTFERPSQERMLAVVAASPIPVVGLAPDTAVTLTEVISFFA